MGTVLPHPLELQTGIISNCSSPNDRAQPLSSTCRACGEGRRAQRVGVRNRLPGKSLRQSLYVSPCTPHKCAIICAGYLNIKSFVSCVRASNAGDICGEPHSPETACGRFFAIGSVDEARFLKNPTKPTRTTKPQKPPNLITSQLQTSSVLPSTLLVLH
jgi:hypothetical protein